MNIRPLKCVKGPTLLVGMTALLCLGVPAHAQNTATPDNGSAQDNSVRGRQLGDFDQFLDHHREIAEQVRKDPSLLDKRDFVNNHPELKTFLQDHPEIRDSARQNPDAFMQEADRFNRPIGMRDRDEIGRFHEFLDGHRDVAEQCRRDPSLLNNRDFVERHPDLRTYLEEHPGARDQIRSNANAFMQEEARSNRPDQFNGPDNRNRDEMTRFHEFLDGHREIAEQCRRDPSLLDNRDFVDHHPELRTYLEEHPGARDQIRSNANAFMQEEARFNRPDQFNRPGDRNRDEIGRFHEFLDGHREIAEQVRRDPTLLDNRDFVEHHPELRTYFQDHPGVRDDIRQDRYAFMQQENQFNRSNDTHDRDFNHDHVASFGGFLGGHAAIARDVSQNPAVVKDRGYVETHPEFKAYLDANPGVRDQLTQNPQEFVKRAREFNNNNGTNGSGSPMKSPGTSPGTSTTTTPTPTPAPKREH